MQSFPAKRYTYFALNNAQQSASDVNNVNIPSKVQSGSVSGLCYEAV
jgi:hypothetical protein